MTKRVLKGLARLDEPVMFRLAGKIYRFIHPDAATALGVVSAFATFALYMFGNRPSNYLWACVPIIAHGFFDGVDGKIAKLRGINRRWGVLLDKVADFACCLFFVSGFFYSTFGLTVAIVMIVLSFVIYFLNIYFCMVRHVEFVLGGTEARIVLMVLNVIVWFKLSFRL